MRKALLAALVAVLLLVLYAAAGHWLAPRFVRDALIERAQRLGLALHIGEVRTDPFALSVTLVDLRVVAGERELARAGRLGADLAWSSLWDDAWHVQQATLLAPQVEIVRMADGGLAWPVKAGEAGSSGGAPGFPIFIESLSVEDGAVHFVERSPRAAIEEVRLHGLALRATGLSTSKSDRGHYELSARIASGGMLSSEGSVSLEPLAAEGRLDIAAVPLGAVLDEGSGRLHGSAQYVYSGETLVLRDVSLEGADVAHSGIELSRLALSSPEIVVPAEEAFEVKGKATLASAGGISASGRVHLQLLSADLEVEAAGLPLRQAAQFLPDGAAIAIASGTASASGRLRGCSSRAASRSTAPRASAAASTSMRPSR